MCDYLMSNVYGVDYSCATIRLVMRDIAIRNVLLNNPVGLE